MTRWELITSDEYILASIECFVVSRKPIVIMRGELAHFFIELRDELLKGDPNVQVSDTTGDDSSNEADKQNKLQ